MGVPRGDAAHRLARIDFSNAVREPHFEGTGSGGVHNASGDKTLFLFAWTPCPGVEKWERCNRRDLRTPKAPFDDAGSPNLARAPQLFSA